MCKNFFSPSQWLHSYFCFLSFYTDKTSNKLLNNNGINHYTFKICILQNLFIHIKWYKLNAPSPRCHFSFGQSSKNTDSQKSLIQDSIRILAKQRFITVHRIRSNLIIMFGSISGEFESDSKDLKFINSLRVHSNHCYKWCGNEELKWNQGLIPKPSGYLEL